MGGRVFDAEDVVDKAKLKEFRTTDVALIEECAVLRQRIEGSDLITEWL